MHGTAYDPAFHHRGSNSNAVDGKRAFLRQRLCKRRVVWQRADRDWYEGLAGDAYQENYDNGKLHGNNDYATYMTAFDTMVGFGDIMIDAGTVVSDGFDAEGWYNDLPANVVTAMNTTSTKFGNYVTREITGKAHKWDKDVPADGGTAERATEYLYAYHLDPTQERGYVGPTNLPKIIINAGNQSDERGAIYGTYYLINDILYNWDKDPVLEYLRHNVKLVIIPCQTPGGVNNGNTYWNANHVNVNRNYSEGFIQLGGYDFVEDANGEWVAYDHTGEDYNGNEKTVTSYRKAEAGEQGTHTRVSNIIGYFSESGESILFYQKHTQNSGHAPFDQGEACAQRDLILRNKDAFYFVDFHTNTSGPYPTFKNGQPQWKMINWLSIGTQPDAYCRKLLGAADWHLDRMSENIYETYNLSEFGCAEGTMLGYTTQTDSTNGSTRAFARSNGILAMAIESNSGFPKTQEYPNGILGGRYSPCPRRRAARSWVTG